MKNTNAMSQKQRLYNLLSDGKAHRTDEILETVYGVGHSGIARIGARINDLKKDGYIIDGKTDKVKKSLYWYRMEIKKEQDTFEF